MNSHYLEFEELTTFLPSCLRSKAMTMERKNAVIDFGPGFRRVYDRGRVLHTVVWLVLPLPLLLLLILLPSCLIAGGTADSVTIVVVSDLNEAYGTTTYSRHVDKVLQYIAELHPDLVLCAGDMIAGQRTTLSETNLRAMWTGFDQHILKVLQGLRIPFAFTLGNHDGSSSPNFQRERSIAEQFWQQNRPSTLNFVDSSRFPYNYSFLFRGIFFAIIDASTARVDTAQRVWLTQQLAQEAATTARVRVILGHLPLYAITQGRDRPGDVLSDADALHSLFCRLGANYYISGHHHGFYISAKNGLVMLSSGALGGGPRKLLGCDRAPRKTVTTLRLLPADNSFHCTTHDVTNGMTPIHCTDLPTALPGRDGTTINLATGAWDTTPADASTESAGSRGGPNK